MDVHEAYEYVKLKWEFLSKDGNQDLDELSRQYPVLDTFKAQCAYCSIFIADRLHRSDYCVGCPLNIVYNDYKYSLLACLRDGHPFLKWNKNRTKENAQKVLDLIYETKPQK